MAYTVPTFPITCNIFTGPWLTKTLRIADQVCNLGQGRRVLSTVGFDAPQFGFAPAQTQLLLPPGVDIRDPFNVGDPDVIECPAGSGRWYEVSCVDDFGKGFTNEHRYALIVKICEKLQPVYYAGCFWPIPIP